MFILTTLFARISIYSTKKNSTKIDAGKHCSGVKKLFGIEGLL